MKDKHRHNRRVNHICAYIVMFIAFIVFPLIAGGIDSGTVSIAQGIMFGILSSVVIVLLALIGKLDEYEGECNDDM